MFDNEFIKATRIGDFEKCNHLLKEKNFDYINKRGADEKTPLIIAAEGHMYSHYKLVELFLENGASVHDSDRTGSSSLLVACRNGKLKIVQLLLSVGANVHDKNNYNGTNSLLSASYSGYFEIVELLLNYGANVNEKRTSDGASPLLLAILGGHVKIIELLVAKGANVNDKNNYGDSCILCATKKGYKNVVSLLLENGANVNDFDNDNVSSLMVAVERLNTDLIELLMNSGADINQRNSRGQNSLAVLSLRRSNFYIDVENICRVMLSKGADFKDIDNNASSIIKAIVAKWPLTMIVLILQDLFLYYILDAGSITDICQYIGDKFS